MPALVREYSPPKSLTTPLTVRSVFTVQVWLAARPTLAEMVWVPVPPVVIPFPAALPLAVPASMTSMLAGVPVGAVPGAIVTVAAEAPKVRLLMSVLLSRVEARAESMVTLD